MGKPARFSLISTVAITASVILLFSLVVTTVSGDEVVRDGIRLILHQDSGRFSLSRLDPQDGSELSLLFPKDPRTSVLSIAAGNMVYRMGESAGFSREMITDGNGGEISWESPKLRITQHFAIERREDPFPMEGLLIRIDIENRSDAPLPVGARMLLDTWLGEAEAVHFRTDTVARVTGERRIPGSLTPAWWLSPAPEQSGNRVSGAREPGLYVLSAGYGITPPDTIVFANWKRLHDAVWDYRIIEGRGYGMAGFPVDDSAAAVYYEPEPVDPGRVRSIALFLGVPAPERSPGSRPSIPRNGPPGTVQADPAAVSAGTDPLTEIEMLIRRIERLLAEGRASSEEIEEIERRISELRNRPRTPDGDGK